MKKFAMLIVKGAVGLLPLSIKGKLKQNTFLTELYSRSLRRSGLFYGFGSKRKRNALYKQFLKYQQRELGKHQYSHEDKKLNVVIVGSANIDKTLTSLNSVQDKVAHVVAVTSSASGTLDIAPTLQEAVSSCEKVWPTLFIQSGDTLSEFAISEFIEASRQYDLGYCDTDLQTNNTMFVSPRFLPDWNPDLQFSTAYINTGVVINSSCLALLKQESIQSIAELVTCLWLQNQALRIAHIPYTLVHVNPSSSVDSKTVADVGKLVNEMELVTDIEHSAKLGINRILWSTKHNPLVSLIIPTKDAWQLVKACIDSIREKSLYTNYEIIVIDNGSTEAESISYFNSLKNSLDTQVINYPGPFNYSAINNFGVKHAKGEIIGLINNDIEVISPQWLTYMVGHALRDDVGCVGAKLLYADDRIQHAGVVLGYGGGAGHAHKYFPSYHPGYLKRLAATNNFSAVTAACLLVRKQVFEQVGGLNEQDLAVAFNDVDFCLRVQELGLRNIYCAEAELYHHESISRGLDIAPEKAARFNSELTYLQTRWADIIKHDPAYNPNLTLRHENFTVKEFDHRESASRS